MCENVEKKLTKHVKMDKNVKKWTKALKKG